MRRRRLSPVRTAALARGTVRLREAWATWISKVRALVSGTDQDSAGKIEAPQQETATIAAPETVTEAKPLQVVSIDHIDPADLMRLDPNQLDHDPILKALVTGYQQGAARAEGDFPSPEWKGGRS